MDTRTAQALIRFGLGRRGEEALPPDPTAWLLGQLASPDPGLTPAPATESGLAALREDRQSRPEPGQSRSRALYRAETAALAANAVVTAMPFRERLVWFWANHFTISLRQPACAAVAGAFVQEAIRPHVTARFGDMLLAVMRHPAMLLYLNNAQSIGPSSPAGLRTHRGLNENLARECLELHTVGAQAGYTQADVTAFAAILTGWSIALDPAGFRFRSMAHEPGAKTLMGRTFPPGEEGGVEALGFLAAHRATHRQIAEKLARHFVADDPPAEAVRRLEATLRDTGGDLGAASRALVGLEAAWQPLGKLRSPLDYTVAALRALDLPPERRPDLLATATRLGQPWFAAPLPNGWPDRGPDWTSGLLRRVDWAYGLAGQASEADGFRIAAGRSDLAASFAGVSTPMTFASRTGRPLTRRAALLGLTAASTLGGSSLAMAHAPTDRRFVAIILRGALDGLAAVAPYGDPALRGLRGELALAEPGSEPDDGERLLDLGGFYGLHPALSGMHAMYRTGEMLVVHAVAGPSRTRSHFEGQDCLESGADHLLASGWLNRAVQAFLNPAHVAFGDNAVAVGPSVPLLLRGPAAVGNWAPAGFPALNDDLYARVAALHRSDPVTGPAIAEALKARDFAGTALADSGRNTRGGDFKALAAAAGRFLAAPDGPRVAALELGGWDTHADQKRRLRGVLKQLDDGLVALRTNLGDGWPRTAVLVMTEFGRTARANGTGGTDHGTGTVALVLGGAVSGGQVRATWPGLGGGKLLEDRDLQPTADLRSIAKGLLADQLGLSAAALAEVFPRSTSASPIGRLIRT